MALNIKGRGEVIYPTDFYIEIDSIVDRAGNSIDLETMPFHFEFFDYSTFAKIRVGRELLESDVYVVSFDGTSRVNNTLDNGVLKFKFENYPIRSGNIYYKQVESYSDAAFEDTTEDVVTILRTNIIVKSAGYNDLPNTSSFNGNITLGALRGEALTFDELTDAQKAEIKGDKGDDGTTPHIGTNGNWFIGDIDTGVSADGTIDIDTMSDNFNSII